MDCLLLKMIDQIQKIAGKNRDRVCLVRSGTLGASKAAQVQSDDPVGVTERLDLIGPVVETSPETMNEQERLSAPIDLVMDGNSVD